MLGKRLELEAVRADGSEFPIELAITAIGAGSTPMFTGFIRDITARKEADEKIRRLNRVYAVLSGINSLIVRVKERDELFDGACRMAIESGGFSLAWIGVVDRTAMQMKLVAWQGAGQDYLERMPLSLSETDGRFGLAGRAARDNQPIVVDDMQHDPRVLLQQAGERDFHSLVMLPLTVSGTVAGVLALYANEIGFFDESEMTLLRDLAGDIAFALEHIEKEEKVHKLARIRAVSSETNAAILRIRERSALLEETCRIVSEHGKFGMVWIGTIDEAARQVEPISWKGFSEEAARAVGWASITSSKGTLGEAIRTRKPSVRNDIEGELPGGGLRAEALKQGCRSSVCLPLMVEGRVAVLIVLFAAGRGFFDEEELGLLAGLAGNISFALEHIGKAGKLERITRVNAMLSGINAAIVRIRDRQELFQEACRIAVETGGLPFACLCILDEAEMRLRPAAFAGVDDGFLEAMRERLSLRDEAPAGYSIAARSVREKNAVAMNDAAALPLFIAVKVVGTFVLHAAEAGFFDDDEMKLLAEVAGNIAFALEHIEKEEKVQRLTRVQAVLSGINALIVRVKDREALFDDACRIAVDAGRFRMSWIGMVNAMKIEPVASAGADPGYMELLKDRFSLAEELPAGDTLTARAVREKKAMFSNDTQNDPRVQFREEHIERGTRSIALLPLLVAGEAVGVLALYAEEADFFDAEEITLLTELAGDIAFALENLGRQQKLDKLARIRAISSQINAAIVRIREPEALLRETCRIAAEHGKFDLVWTGLVDQAKQRIQPVAWNGFSSEVAHNLTWTHLGNPLMTLAEVLRTRKVAVRNDTSGESPVGTLRHQAMQQGYRSAACVPFMVDEALVAAMILFAPERAFFDAEELALLNEVGADVSFALQATKKQEQLDYLAYYDPLTGLANRRLFLERVAQYMRSAAAGGHQLALFFLDLERFRYINDSLGRPAGDALLKQVAAWLTRNLGDASLVARAGGDIFAVVLPEVTPQGNVARLVEKTMDAFLSHPFRLNDSVFRITFKVGVALFPDDGAEVDTLFRNAEAALKKAKATGDRYLFYAEKMTAAVAGRLTLENQLRQALEREEFVLHYQPKVNLASGKLTSAEALIRWNDPQSGLVPAGRFIPVLEETGLIYEVGRWALRKAVADYLRWRAAGLPAVRIAVNVSPLQLRNRGFVAEIGQVIGIDPQAAAGLELEITESVIMEDVKHNIASLKAIREMDVRIAIDDFGTGFSSLSYLAKLPVDTLKIDRSFVVDMTAGPQGLSLVSTIINLAHSLKLKVVAEGVETEEQSRLLRLLNCDEMQGYLFSKPVAGSIFEASFLSRSLAAQR
jgi:diguanylate cyclase (GGDEF)-like protein